MIQHFHEFNRHMLVTKHLRIFGRVQGVCFRNEMSMAAERLGVSGWVRNRADGSVEAMVHGAPEAVDAIITWARRGPQLARVTEVQIADAEGSFTGFDQVRSV
jgi:acylphosphatase